MHAIRITRAIRGHLIPETDILLQLASADIPSLLSAPADNKTIARPLGQRLRERYQILDAGRSLPEVNYILPYREPMEQ